MCHGKIDPLYRATWLPIVAFVRAIWESWVPVRVVETSMSGCRGIKHWTQVQGPGGAVRLSLERVGWTVLEPFRWLTHEGGMIDVRE
eukprot:2092967-Pyramimonas_sp.AAC.1